MPRVVVEEGPVNDLWLNGIFGLRACALGFEILVSIGRVARIESVAAIRVTHQSQLRRGTGHYDAGGGTVLVNAVLPYDAFYAVAVLNSHA